MRVIFGLGNPESRYNFTRHNIGFQIIDLFTKKNKISLSPGKGDFYFCKSAINGSEFLVVKPTTYMNRSGLAAFDICDDFKVSPENFLVITDDVHLQTGKLRIRKAGGDGGHNGLKSIIYHLQTDQFPRLRFGVGKEFDEGEMADYVLSKFDTDTLSEIEPVLQTTVSLLEEFIIGGTQAMLNLFSKSSQS